MSIMETLATPVLPEPMVPAEVVLRGFPFMPVEIEQVRRSKEWLACKRRPELAFFMMNLKMSAWHEIPAASHENDDDVLADRAMCPPDLWPSVKNDVMREWVLCSDGRLYHPAVAEKAMAAWDRKQEQRARTAAATEARKGKGKGRKGEATSAATAPAANVTINVTSDATNTVTNDVTTNVTTDVTDTATSTVTNTQRSPTERERDSREGDSTTPLHFVPGGGCAPDPVATTTDPERLIEAFDAVLVETWGEKAARRAPHSTDFDVAQDLAEAGVTADLMAEVCLKQFGQMRSRPKTKPPWSLSVVAGDVRAAMVAAQAASLPVAQSSVPKAPAPYRGILTDDDFARWIAPCDVGLADGEAIITAPSPVAADWIRTRLEVGLLRALKVRSIRIKVDPSVTANPIPHPVPERAA